jgi:hypothetical protein
MKTTSHPNFILGLFSLLLIFVGLGLRANGYRGGDAVFMAAIGLGAIHWIWSIIDVFKHYRTNNDTENKNILWVILVVIVPPVGGLLYYSFSRKVSM